VSPEKKDFSLSLFFPHSTPTTLPITFLKRLPIGPHPVSIFPPSDWLSALGLQVLYKPLYFSALPLQSLKMEATCISET
jgi:hypothetical protein